MCLCVRIHIYMYMYMYKYEYIYIHTYAHVYEFRPAMLARQSRTSIADKNVCGDKSIHDVYMYGLFIHVWTVDVCLEACFHKCMYGCTCILIHVYVCTHMFTSICTANGAKGLVLA